MEVARVIVDGQEVVVAHDRPLLVGRGDADGILGLDPSDMGISAKAVGVEFADGIWWLTNHSSKRPVYIDETPGTSPRRLECRRRHAICEPATRVLVPGAIYTHRLEIRIPEAALAPAQLGAPVGTSGTLTDDGVALSSDELAVLTALFSGFLRAFPKRNGHPLSYRQAAELLGEPWTATKVRKRVEHLRERFTENHVYFEGPHARYDLGMYLIDRGLLTAADLDRLESTHRG